MNSEGIWNRFPLIVQPYVSIIHQQDMLSLPKSLQRHQRTFLLSSEAIYRVR